MMKLAEIEPIANLFIQDMLRGSPMLFFSQILDSLSRDASQLVGTTHKFFDRQIGIGLHALNPGLVRGTLYATADINDFETFDPQGIYLLPETISELPPIAGIITIGEGNPLSHIQLLARNLGIPNITVNENLLEKIQAHDGETIVMAVSPNGLIELNSDSEQWRDFFSTQTNQENIIIRPDLEKLNLTVREFIDMGTLRASDSGRIVGPKAAKLGELHFHYPDKVAKGLAIPFGLFREIVLDAPYKNTEQTVFEWMESQYAIIDGRVSDLEQHKLITESFRAEIYDIIINTDMGDHYRKQLQKSMIKIFGDTEIGVFIRSDTNVEDLPNFTGAGLNLTLFNIVGMDNIIKGINKVWASPFTARAFSWRQSLMETPQHVYPAILLMQTVANDKSGVMVTQNIDTGDMNILSVASNEGVGGAVDGQSAESLHIDIRNKEIRLLATASAPFRKVPSPKGGIVKLPVSGSETVLKPNEIQQLIQFAKDLPDTFPPIIDEKGNSAPADIEFGFYNEKLQLFQLRPFLQSSKAQGSSYLINMDKRLESNMNKLITMSAVAE
jgi:phosphoenolpyruvate synthase/pyruvate phosphate dikinase